MLLTVDKLNIEFNDDITELKKQYDELERLEKAIESSTHYKLLSGKTQMIGKDRGKTKKERSRMIHTNTIAYSVVERTIRKIYDRILENTPGLETSEYRNIFELNREVAVLRGRIMSKAHDIGHVAFGHEGEKAIARFVEYADKTPEEIDAWLDEHETYFGEEYEADQGHDSQSTSFSFEHNELSAILLNQIAERENIDISPKEMRRLTLGVLGHSTSRTPIHLLDGDIVAQIVRVADKVEYINADWDEVSTLINIDSNIESELVSYMQKTKGERIDHTNSELVEEAFRLGNISEKHTSMRRLARMRRIYDDIIYLYDGNGSDMILNELIDISNNQEALEEYYAQNEVVRHLYPSQFVRTTLKDVRRLAILEELLDISDNPRALDRFYDRYENVEQLYPRDFVETILKDTKAALPLSKRYQIDNLRRSGDTYNLVSAVIDEIGKQYRNNRHAYSEHDTLMNNINHKYRRTYNAIFDEKVFFKSVMQGENSDRIHFIYRRILDYYYKHPEQIPVSMDGRVTPIDILQSKEFSYDLNTNYTNLQKVLEYISLFDDKSLMDKYRDLVRERRDKGPGYGIEPVTIEEIKEYLKRKEGSFSSRSKLAGEFVDAAMIDARKNDYSTHNDEEILRRYVEKCEEYFASKLTPEGQKARSEFYRLRFSELAEDIELRREIDEADRKYGRLLPEEPEEKITPMITIQGSLGKPRRFPLIMQGGNRNKIRGKLISKERSHGDD